MSRHWNALCLIVEAKRKTRVAFLATRATRALMIVFGMARDRLCELAVVIARLPSTEQFVLRAKRRIWL